MIRQLASILFLVMLSVSNIWAQSPSTNQPSAVDLSAIKAQLTPEEFKQYQSWVAIGVGGLPHTLEGFRTLILRTKGKSVDTIPRMQSSHPKGSSLPKDIFFPNPFDSSSSFIDPFWAINTLGGAPIISS